MEVKETFSQAVIEKILRSLNYHIGIYEDGDYNSELLSPTRPDETSVKSDFDIEQLASFLYQNRLISKYLKIDEDLCVIVDNDKKVAAQLVKRKIDYQMSVLCVLNSQLHGFRVKQPVIDDSITHNLEIKTTGISFDVDDGFLRLPEHGFYQDKFKRWVNAGYVGNMWDY